jgi:hypothetical protein
MEYCLGIIDTLLVDMLALYDMMRMMSKFAVNCTYSPGAPWMLDQWFLRLQSLGDRTNTTALYHSEQRTSCAANYWLFHPT